MDKNLFRYIWRHSKREQIIIFVGRPAVAAILFLVPRSAQAHRQRGDPGQRLQGRQDERHAVSRSRFTLPAFLGGQKIALFEGFTVDQLGLLFGLSALFLLLVLINGAFKYWINVAKGALGERMLRRLRFDLFALALRFPPESLRTVKSSEAATMIKDEVEPIGGFIGDAFVQPVLLGSQAHHRHGLHPHPEHLARHHRRRHRGVQFTVIPRLRRIQLRLGKQRQIVSRKLAGRVGEVVDGMEAVHVHDAHRLGEGGDRPPPLRALRPALPPLQVEVHGQVPEQPARPDHALLLLLGRRLPRAHRQPRHRPAGGRHRRLP